MAKQSASVIALELLLLAMALMGGYLGGGSVGRLQLTRGLLAGRARAKENWRQLKATGAGAEARVFLRERRIAVRHYCDCDKQ
jgi:hypothetical protein